MEWQAGGRLGALGMGAMTVEIDLFSAPLEFSGLQG